jgi:MOSC domain-containing protein YiiM
LQRLWGHTKLGVYARVTRDGQAKPGDRIAVQI